jgi:hypothetical protein
MISVMPWLPISARFSSAGATSRLRDLSVADETRGRNGWHSTALRASCSLCCELVRERLFGFSVLLQYSSGLTGTKTGTGRNVGARKLFRNVVTPTCHQDDDTASPFESYGCRRQPRPNQIFRSIKHIKVSQIYNNLLQRRTP